MTENTAAPAPGDYLTPGEVTRAMQMAGVVELRNPEHGVMDYARVCAIYRNMRRAAPAAAAAESFIHDANERDVICKRMRRVARAVGIESAMPDDETLYACIGTMLGTIASAVERATAQLSQLRPDVARLDWLDMLSNEALLEFGFEMDGGVYLRIDAPGHGGTDIREKNSARAAIDSGMIIAPTGAPGG